MLQSLLDLSVLGSRDEAHTAGLFSLVFRPSRCRQSKNKNVVVHTICVPLWPRVLHLEPRFTMGSQSWNIFQAIL